jgi:hypothetical protein
MVALNLVLVFRTCKQKEYVGEFLKIKVVYFSCNLWGLLLDNERALDERI